MKAIIYLVLLAAVISAGLYVKGPAAEAFGRSKIFFIEEKVYLKNIPDGDIRIWMPYPSSDGSQEIENLEVISPFDARFASESEYGNRLIYIKAKGRPSNGGSYEIILSFKVARREAGALDEASISREKMPRFLKPDRLVPVGGGIEALARKISEGKRTDVEKARAIYDYIIDELSYSKDDPKVCGLGNTLLTLEHKKGICSDYHSLFISLVRSLGIPAKFEIGFPLPAGKREGKIGGYHCWAKFYIKGKGWIPVDISEADKHPGKRNYYFGHIDENRVMVTVGRDIRLEYASAEEPLNFFVYPYVEVNGSRFDHVDVDITFKELEGGDRP